MQGHKELIIWQKAMNLVEAVYKLTKSFPKTEIYGLASQIQKGGSFSSVEHRGRSRA